MSAKVYKQALRSFIVTSRFNTETWLENKEFRKNHPSIQCIYGAPDPVKKEIPLDTPLFVLEMNNDTNKIEGIGLIQNRPSKVHYKIYNDGNYNRYKYIGYQHISREDMTIEEEDIMQVFDILCFTGNKHLKRGQGLKTFPIETLFRCSSRMDLVKFVSTMFEKRQKEA